MKRVYFFIIFYLIQTVLFAYFGNLSNKNRIFSLFDYDIPVREDNIGLHFSSDLSYSYVFKNLDLFQTEYSFKVYYDNDLKFDSYRYWLRYSNMQRELRIGHQRINFGTAKILRPLQWFDKINPLDKNEETKGVDAVLFRSYTLDNRIMWFWVI